MAAAIPTPQMLTASASLASAALIAYHHVIYPGLLRIFARKPVEMPPLAGSSVPGITIVMPAYNEARYIARKIRNVAALDYPAHRLKFLILCDGCNDATAQLARDTLAEDCCHHLDAEVIEHHDNRGKVARLNEGVARARGEIVVFSDVSSMLPADALRRAAAHFADPQLGAVGGTYRIENPGSEGESAYWRMQLAVKRGEAGFGAPLGLHGAFYAFRRAAYTALPLDTINDDFIQPMKILAQGYRVAYDEAIVATELERISQAADMRRRRRIAAGNVQQLLRLLPLLHPRRGGVAFAFASGKALRVLMPVLIVTALAGSLGLAGQSPLFAAMSAAALAGLALAALGAALGERAPRLLRVLHYLAAGHAMSALGGVAYLRGEYGRPWQRANAAIGLHVPPAVGAAKRLADIAIAAVALLLTAPLWPLIALGIKLTSPGPVIFRQLRIGRALPDRTEIFRMMKFRTMYQDAEARSGAVWATRNDPRITPFGLFLRKTRLDEIPQLINVLRGDMAIVGPRPERPGFYRKLEQAIPYFAERTIGLRPGITGLAQVNQGYDTSLDDVRRKVAFDHAYGIRMARLRSWLMLDAGIMLRTLAVMATGRGQ